MWISVWLTRRPKKSSNIVSIVREAEPVGDVLVHGPTLQAVEVLVQPLVLLGDEALAAVEAPMHVRPALDHLPLDARRGEHEVERPLDPRPPALDRLSLRDEGEVLALAEGALLTQ